MGASNFARGNASKVYAVLMNQEETFKECTECGLRHYDYDYNLDELNECKSCNEVLFEQVFEKVSTPLNVRGTFSNGKTIYEKA